MTYSTAQITFHWLTVLLLLVLIGSGLAYSYEWAGREALQAHQIAGQALIVILGFRLIARFSHHVPHAEGHAVWERTLASGVHVALYLCLIAFVVTGYVSASALTNNMLSFPVSRSFARSDTGEILLEIHYLLKWVLLGLFTLHFAGALKHMIIDRDGTMSRMLFSSR